MSAAPAFQSEIVLERMVRAVREGRAQWALELACGPGIVAEAVAPVVGRFAGIDATPRMVHLAAARCRAASHPNCRFHVAGAEHLPFRDGTFDVVISRLAIHHFSAPGQVLSEVHRVIRRDGRLIVADIVSASDAEEAKLHNALEKLRDPTHVRMPAESQLAALMEASGFEVLRRESWKQPRHFSEWAAIIADAERTAPLRVIMAALARSGQRAGIGLEEVDGDLRFEHTWQLVVARPAAARQDAAPLAR